MPTSQNRKYPNKMPNENALVKMQKYLILDLVKMVRIKIPNKMPNNA